MQDNSSSSTRENPLADAALAYARAGVPVFPLNGKRPFETGGFRTATVDEDTITAWWSRWPTANIGTPTGSHVDAITGHENSRPFDVLDVDTDTGGFESLTALAAEHGEFPGTVAQVTGSGGRHIFFASRGHIRNSAGVLAPGLDIRGTGGYVVLPPSMHPETGQPYQWVDKRGLLEHELAPMPKWLTQLLNEKGKKTRPESGGRIPEGQREATLLRIAGAMRRQGATRDEIKAALSEANRTRCDPPLVDADIDRLATSATKRDPADLLTSAPCDDLGNAQRFVHVNHNRARWCVDHQRWYVWNGQVWDSSNQAAVVGLAGEVVRATQIAAAELPSTDQNRDAVSKHAGKMGNERSIKAMVDLAKNPLAVQATDFDQDPWLLNCPNGIVDLRTGVLLEHDPRYLCTQITNVAFDSTAAAETFEKFFADILSDDKALIDFVHRALGYSLTGDTSEQTYLVLTGDGGNGKGVLMRLMAAVLGTYAWNLPGAALLRGKSSNQGFDVADLPGKRFVTSTETTSTDYIDEQRIKALTGQEAFTAEHKYGRPFSFTPVGKLWLGINGLPKADDGSRGFWRRPAVVHFQKEYSPEDRPTLWEELSAELPGILAWMVRGCLAWQENALRPFPAEVAAAVQEWRADSDPLSPFLAECCEPLEKTKKGTTLKRDLLTAYEQWCYESGEEGIKTKGRGAEWTKALKRHGIRATTGTHGVPSWKGVQLNTDWRRRVDNHNGGHIYT